MFITQRYPNFITQRYPNFITQRYPNFVTQRYPNLAAKATFSPKVFGTQLFSFLFDLF